MECGVKRAESKLESVSGSVKCGEWSVTSESGEWGVGSSQSLECKVESAKCRVQCKVESSAKCRVQCKV